jgi:hypothetical protein
MGSRVRNGGVIRFNPSPFEREGVPGNGWAVAPAGHESTTVPVRVEVLADGWGVAADGLDLRLFDEPDVGDLYNFCYADPEQVPAPPSSVSVDGHDVTATWEGLTVRMRVTRRADEDLLRLEGVIDNARPDHRLRLHVALGGPVAGSLAGSPFELVQRPRRGEGSGGEPASPTWPARGAVMAGGVALFHEGVFEYEVTDAPSIAATMLRCVGAISRPDLATRPFDAGPHTPTPDAQMIGVTAFALGAWPEAERDGLLERWERFALPLAEAQASGGGTLPSTGAFTPLAGAAQLSNVRRRDGRLEVRLWNPWDDREVVAEVGGVAHTLGPARIERFEVR